MKRLFLLGIMLVAGLGLSGALLPGPRAEAAPPGHPAAKPATVTLTAAYTTAGDHIETHITYAAEQKVAQAHGRQVVVDSRDVTAVQVFVNGTPRATQWLRHLDQGQTDLSIALASLPPAQRAQPLQLQAKLYTRFSGRHPRHNKIAAVSGVVTLPAPGEAVQVSWSPNPLTASVLSGTSKGTSVSVRADKAISQPALQVSDSLDGIVALPADPPASLAANTGYPLNLRLTAPGGKKAGDYTGFISLLSAGTVVSKLPVTVTITAASATTVPQAVNDPTDDRITTAGNNYLVKDELLVGLDGSVANPDQRIQEIAAAAQGVVMGSVPGLGFYQLRFPGVTTLPQLEDKRAAVAAMTGVSYASHNYLGTSEATPNDSEYSASSWDSGSTDLKTWGLRYINAPAAWDLTTGSPDTRIGIIDGYFDATHDDLFPNVTRFVGYEAADPPTFWHGTHVAGDACAAGNNGIGVTGVSWKCSLNLYAIQLDSTKFAFKETLASTIAMMKQAADNGMRVVNLSAGFVDANTCVAGTPETEKVVQEVNRNFEKAIAYATDSHKDVLWVFSAGNECRDVKYASPASLGSSYPNVISVAAVGPSGSLFKKSNFGSVSVAAPGERIYNTDRHCIPSTHVCLSTYDYQDGTSMAAPYVTGLAGLVFTKNPELTASQAKECIVNAANINGHFVPGNPAFSVIDAPHAVQCQKPTPPCAFLSGVVNNCESTDPHVTVSANNSGNTSGCTFGIHVDWGDGTSDDTEFTGRAASGPIPFGSHTYGSTPKAYTITATGTVKSGFCTISNGSYTFTLLPTLR